ncbi:Na+/H+ antiporter NhaA [Plebeiibacterium marinum]|uniref:Na(+)/H(+) antiporter NhaA n=1 Tax=Plebeiibacterium marinum TaxID=2992111 RepID=A0AAE3MBH4_9BACT|nr:Na+/H+ antiporter NhaA [Plebeiobacterium marinum]MCW3804731.1 Na+/H+ antiporter NhaA [Plebeiobacterium marinum]
MTNVEDLNGKSFFQRFYSGITSGSSLLMIATFAAVIWANVDHHFYEHLWHDKLTIDVNAFHLKMSWHHWINDGLMAIFFFVVGLEIKREFLAGELSSFKQASLPIFAAIGGMVVPIILFFMFGLEGEAQSGWGIPMATDIAFSLGILAMLGKRVPLSLKVFLTALAIVDDLGAVLVIALFYGGELQWTYLIIAAVLLIVLTIANLKNIQDLKLYTILGLVIWYLFLESGVEGPGSGLHATIAGVLVAFTIPARPKVHVDKFLPRISSGAKNFESIPKSVHEIVLSDEQLHAVDNMEYAIKKVRSPLQYIEHQFHGFISMFVLPVFALANAGVVLSAGDQGGEVMSLVSFAIAFSLVFGKVIGITFFSWLAVRLRIAIKPKGSSWLSFAGLGLLGGIGFTMSIFIASLAYSTEILNQAKIGIFIGSIIAGLAGFFLLKYSLKRDEDVTNRRMR